MLRKAGEICSLLLVGLALGFWVIAITTHGWLVVVHKIKRRKTIIGPAYSKQEVTSDIGVFYSKYCKEELCHHFSFIVPDSVNRNLKMPSQIEMQIESVIAALLCAVCFILLLISIQSTTKRFLHVAIILPFSVFFQSVLIGRTSKANANVIVYKEFGWEKKEIRFPYSILLAGIGVLFAIIAWMLSIAIYCKLPRQRLQSLQDQNLDEDAETSHVVSLDQNMTDTSYSAIKETQVQYKEETSKISTSVSQQTSCSPVMISQDNNTEAIFETIVTQLSKTIDK